MARTDIHRPSSIKTEDYDFVGCELIKVEGLGDAGFLKAERQTIRNHMERTGGKYSRHAHGGNCHVCGNANAIYTMLFHHRQTNTYIRVGQDCAEKMEAGSAAFRSLRRLRDGVEQERKIKAGQVKAQATLENAGLNKAWNVYKDWKASHVPETQREENTIRDIVGKLVRYGSVSDKQMDFIGSLLKKIDDRPNAEAARKREYDAAAMVPESNERQVIKGKILSIKWHETLYGSVQKILVQHESGYKLHGTLPRGLNASKGDVIEFSAKVEASKEDPKFGFFSRPTKAKVIKREQGMSL